MNNADLLLRFDFFAVWTPARSSIQSQIEDESHLQPFRELHLSVSVEQSWNGSTSLFPNKRNRSCTTGSRKASYRKGGCATAPSDGLAGKNIKLGPLCRAGSTPVPAKSLEFLVISPN